jgi:hypothetical protein
MVREVLNVLPIEEFKKLEEEVFSPTFHWYYARRGNDGSENPFLNGWSRFVYAYRGDVEYVYDDPNNTLVNTARRILKLAGEEYSHLLRVRYIMNTISDRPYLNGAHVDSEGEHRVGLFYLNDADGSTIIYNEKFDPTLKIQSGEYLKQYVPELTVEKKVQPVANKLLIFDGLQYHTGTVPVKTARRIAINIDYLTPGMKY